MLIKTLVYQLRQGWHYYGWILAVEVKTLKWILSFHITNGDFDLHLFVFRLYFFFLLFLFLILLLLLFLLILLLLVLLILLLILLLLLQFSFSSFSFFSFSSFSFFSFSFFLLIVESVWEIDFFNLLHFWGCEFFLDHWTSILWDIFLKILVSFLTRLIK